MRAEWIALGAVCLSGWTGEAGAATLHGRIANASGKPVASAVVTLLPRGLIDTTKVDGLYSFETSTGVGPSRHAPVRPRFEGRELVIPVGDASTVGIDVFDTKGHHLTTERLAGVREGVYRWSPGTVARSAGLLLVRVTVDGEATMFRMASLDGSWSGNYADLQGGLARSAAIPDSLVVVAKGYAPRRIPVASLDATLDVTLDTIMARGIPLGNQPVPSAGCGKTSTIKSGTFKMTSAGLSREYIVYVPDKYSSSKPSRLIFGMHWMNGSDEAVQGWSKWFGLQPLDTARNTVFVAPNGYGTPPLWTQGTKDHTFFDDLVKTMEAGLCIDQSRIFSVGFSFGAMFTNSLAQTHQDVLRGVVVYAAADYNIYFPANTGKPLAYMGVHGLKDPTCPIAAGRSSRDRFVKNNGCVVPATVPETKAGGSYVTYDYKCPDNLPVRWITFDGAHTYPPNNNGTWVHGKTWEFITRF